jgi:uncharacterized protein
METTNYLKVYPRDDKPGRVILFATRRCATLECSDSLWATIRDGGELTEPEIATLTRLGVLVASRTAERDEMLDTFNTINAQSRHLGATVALTLECNLACPYCFEDPFRGHFAMSPDTADVLVERFTGKMAEGLDVTVDFYGGEALLKLGLLKDIASRLGAAARELGRSFAFNLFTNGVLLTRRVVEELHPLGLAAVRLTIDGPADIHDAQRPFVSGNGSFATILANVRDVHHMVPLDIAGNYTRDNYRRFPELLDLLLAEGIDPGKLRAVCFSPVMPKADGSVAGDINSACCSVNEPWMIESALFLREETLRRGFPVPKLKAGACTIEFEKDWVVGYDGSIYKCPVFMGHEEMRVGSLSEGVKDYRTSHNLDNWKKKECLECAYLPLCFGGCRFFRKLNTGSIDDVNCIRGYLDEALERLVRQDLELQPRLR